MSQAAPAPVTTMAPAAAPTRLPASVRAAGQQIRQTLAANGQPVPDFPQQTQLPNIGVAQAQTPQQFAPMQPQMPQPVGFAPVQQQPYVQPQQQSYVQPQQPVYQQPQPVYAVDPAQPFAVPGAPAPAPMDPAVQAMMQQNQALIRMIADRVAPATPTGVQLALPTMTAMTDAQREQFKASDPYIRSVAAELIATATKPLVDEVNTLRAKNEEQTRQLSQRIDTTSRASFDQQFAAILPDMPMLTSSPQFQAYLNEPVPHAPHVRIRDLMSAAHKSGDIGTLKANVDAFKARYAQPSVPQPIPLPMQPFVAPTPASGGYTPPNMPGGPQPQPQVLTFSQRENDFAAYRAGRMPQQEWFVRQAAYDNAAVAGRLDYTK